MAFQSLLPSSPSDLKSSEGEFQPTFHPAMPLRFTHLHSNGRSFRSRTPRRLTKLLSQALFLVVLGFTVLFASTVRRFVFGGLDDYGHTTNVIVRTFVHHDTSPTLPPPPDVNGNPLPREVPHNHQDDERPVSRPAEPQPQPDRNHTYLSNGLLLVNPLSPISAHPIFALIERSERLWKEKLERQSQTLDEAVVEYERRYGRNPPRGFDKWYAHHKRTQTLLPDEYDSIAKSFEPFWRLSPELLTQNQRELEGDRTYVVGKETVSSPLSLLPPSSGANDASINGAIREGSELIMNLLREVEGDIPGQWRAVVRVDDSPASVWGWEARHSATGGVSSTQSNSKRNGWLAACAPDSPAVISGVDLSQRPAQSRGNLAASLASSGHNEQNPMNGPTAHVPADARYFIHSHFPTFSPCLHPSHFQSHGQFLSHKEGPVPEQDYTKFAPVFSYSTTMVHGDVGMAMPWAWIADTHGFQADPGPFNYSSIRIKNEDPIYAQHTPPPFSWEEKYDSRLQWRGSNTGIWHSSDTWWQTSQRIRMMEWANGGMDGWIDVLRSPFSSSVEEAAGSKESTVRAEREEGSQQVGDPLRVRKSDWASAMLDIAFSGRPNQCDEASDACATLNGMWEWRRGMGWEEQRKYKYVLDVDGNGWSNRFKRLITSGSLIFKSTIYPEWWHEHIQPWVHYVPIQNDFSDIWDALTFFRGGPGGAGAHDDLAKKIAEEGRRWSKRFWREEDMTSYMFRLFLEYVRVMHSDRDTSPEVNYNHWGTDLGKRYLQTDAGRKYLQDREVWETERLERIRDADENAIVDDGEELR